MPPAVDRRTTALAGLLCGALLLALGGSTRAEDDDAPSIRNPYYSETKWKVWRADDTPVEGVPSLTGKEKAAQRVQLTIEPTAQKDRLYPVDPPKAGGKDPYVVFEKQASPSKKYAGIWDDVYSSWSGLHGYMRNQWTAPDGSKVGGLRAQVMHFVDVSGRAQFVQPVGVNFIHQSTTGMAHDITNGYSVERTRGFEEIYFSDCLVTSPAHASFTDWAADHTQDLYMGHMPTIFNSLGSSNSETMAITKMIIAGGYLPPETKLRLKQNGLYPAAILHMWKAALPYDVPYGHELRHRIAYKAVGNRFTYPERYGATALDRGDTSLEFHQYDDQAHMRGMVDIARSMDVTLPEALFTVIRVEGGDDMVRLRKSAVILQAQGKDVVLTVSTEGCYDLQDLPLSLRWKLLYGNKRTTVAREPEEPSTWKVTVPADDALPAGRTAIALIANNGRFDSNPAILSVYRRREDLPPGGGYKFAAELANRRPVLLDVQDQWVKRGKEVHIPLRGLDPDGFPLAFHKRAGEVGEIDGDEFTWKCPRKAAKGSKHVVTFIASDETSGNSYTGRQVTLHVEKPALLARIDADVLAGKAPLKVKLSAKGSLGPRSKLEYGWEFYRPARNRKSKGFDKQGKEVEHTFDKPGFHEIKLTVKHGKESDTQVVGVLVTKDPLPTRPAALAVEGNGVRIAPGDDTPDAFDQTRFGAVPEGAAFVERTFRIVNAGDEPLSLRSKDPVTLSGPDADCFRVTPRPRKKLAGRGSAALTVRFTPSKGTASGSAVVEVHTASETFSFTVAAGP